MSEQHREAGRIAGLVTASKYTPDEMSERMKRLRRARSVKQAEAREAEGRLSTKAKRVAQQMESWDRSFAALSAVADRKTSALSLGE